MNKTTRILLIDDHPGVLEVAVDTLRESLDCQVDGVESGQQGVDLCLSNEYNIICTDYIMPNMNGADFIRKIRSSKGLNKKAKIFIVTGDPESAAKDIQDLTDINIIKKVDGVQILVDVLKNYFEPAKA